MKEETGCDGIMVARGAKGNPWLFKRILHYLETGELPAAADCGGSKEDDCPPWDASDGISRRGDRNAGDA